MNAPVWIGLGLVLAAFLYGFVGHFAKRGTEVVQQTAFLSFKRRFSDDPELAAFATLALHPFDGKRVPSRLVRRAIRPHSREFARASRLADSGEELERLALETIDKYWYFAVLYGSNEGDAYYAAQYEAALTQAGKLEGEQGDEGEYPE